MTLRTMRQLNHYYTATSTTNFTKHTFTTLKDAHAFLKANRGVSSYTLCTVTFGRLLEGWYTRAQVKGIETRTPEAIKPRQKYF